MLRSETFCLALIFFILINTDLSEAKGRGGGRGGGSGRGGSRGWYGGSFGGGGDGFDWELFFIIVGVIFGVLFLATCIYVYFIEDDDRIFMQKMIEQNQQHQQNNSDDTHLPYPTIATVDATPPYQSSNQFQENFPQNTNNGEVLSPTPLPYSIAPVDVPPPYPGNQSGTWKNGSWMTNQPNNQFQDNFPQNTSHGAIVSSTHLSYPTIATVDAPPPYPGNQSGT